jgi:hypothetical protein
MKQKLSIKAEQIWLKLFIDQKLDNWFGYLLAFAAAALLGLIMGKNTLLGFGISGFIIGFAVVIVCLLNTEAGLYINVIYSFFAFHFSRFLFNDSFPVGVASDVLVLATFLSLVIRRVNFKKSFTEFTNRSAVIWILILFLYIAIELFNPNAHSFEGWYQTFRKMLGAVLVLFISFNVFTDYRSIRKFLILLFILCVITGIYGCIQQWHGLFNFEIAWAMADENRFGLIFINGDFRKFSTMSDPTAYGVLMAACAVLFIIIAANQKDIRYKITLIIGSVIMILGMAYSGTRTANAMVVGGLALYILLTLHKKNTQVFALIAGVIFIGLMYAPIYDNPTLNRFRTTFLGSKDDSYKVREQNRAFIQPYIYSHPFGGGLCTTGGSGLRFNPDHYLAGFPPDSGYLQKALETGYIGLGIICFLYFAILKSGINGYFSSRNKYYKIIFAACTASIFTFYIAEFSQEAIGQITDLVVYYPLIAMVIKLKYIEEPKQLLPTE